MQTPHSGQMRLKQSRKAKENKSRILGVSRSKPIAYKSQVKPKTVSEEVVIRVSGEVDLPAGTHRLVLVHRNVVDGRLEKLHIGAAPKP